MSLTNFDEALAFLPNLPGYRSKPVRSVKKEAHLRTINGSNFMKEDIFPKLDGPSSPGGGDDGSVNTYNTSMTSFANKIKPRGGPDSSEAFLTFSAYFEEVSSYSTAPIDQMRIRKCKILFSLEAGTTTIIEKPVINSGIPQGKLVRAQVIMKPDGSPYTPEDFNIGETVIIFGKVYHIIDADTATKNYLGIDSSMVPRAMVPRDLYEEYRKSLEKGPSPDWMKYRSKKNANKSFLEASLGRNVNNNGREGYMKFGNQSLRFRCAWDNTDMLYGDMLEFALVYYLSDDTIEINSTGSKGGSFVKLLKRSKLPKEVGAMILGESDSVAKPQYFHWTDFAIGMNLNVYARTLRIMDADNNTRAFYEQNLEPLGLAEFIPEAVVQVHQREIPPSTGFGSEEDSLRSCSGPLQAGPSKAKRQGESKVLSFFAALLSGGLDDVDRRFVVTFYLLDETIKIQEPPVRNSGFGGGVFLSRRAVNNPQGQIIDETQLYVGCKIQILKHSFLLLDADNSTLRWMEDRKLPWSSFYDIMDKIRPVVFVAAKNGSLVAAFQALEEPEHGAGRATKEALRAVLSSFELMGDDARTQTCEHELITILRGTGNKLKSFDYNKIIEQIIKPTDEFK